MTPLGVYVHWPFCAAICPYCDFNVHLARGVDAEDFGTALADEITETARLAPAHVVESVYFGGGTPSLMPPALVEKILTRIASVWRLAADAEVSLEANPEHITPARMEAFCAAGVNRLSLGVQSLEADALAFLGRRHSVEEARAAIESAQRIFAQSSFDLIAARPGQTCRAWREELTEALARAPTHLSIYQLTIEPGTAFHKKRRRGRLTPLDEETSADMFALTDELCAGAGLPAYEVSNHAAPSHACRHNLHVWQGGDYAGIGPGAHGRLTLEGTRHATRAMRAPARWRAGVAARGHGREACAPLGAEAQIEEYLLMGLRLGAGVPLSELSARCGRALTPETFAPFEAAGFVSCADGRLRVCRPRGILVLDSLLPEILPLLATETRAPD